MGISHGPIQPCEARTAFTISRLWLKQVGITWSLRASCPKLCVQKTGIESPSQPAAVPADENPHAEIMFRDSGNNGMEAARVTAGADQLLTVVSTSPVSETMDQS